MKTYGEIKEALLEKRDDHELEAEYGIAGGLHLLYEEMKKSALLSGQKDAFWDYTPEQLTWEQFVRQTANNAEDDIYYYWDRITAIALQSAED